MQCLKQFLKRQKKGDKEALLPFFLPRAERLAELLPQLSVADRGSTGSHAHQHVCTECGAIFIGTGALRRHSQKHHPGVRLFPKGPKFDPKKHSKAGTPECLACGRAFRTYFFLRRHIEISICPCIHVLLQEAHQETGSMTELDQVHAEVKHESLRDPASAASNPDLHMSGLWRAARFAGRRLRA